MAQNNPNKTNMNIQPEYIDFITQKKYAIIGVSHNRAKYGNIVYRNLRSKGYDVYAVNPLIETVEGDRAYPTIASLPEKVDGIVTVVPPHITEKIVQEAASAGITRVWMQEGSESEAAIHFCQTHNMNVIYNECIMVVTNYMNLIN